jgi:hypothetical protein
MVEQDALSYFLRPSPATVPSRGRASTGPIDLDAGEQVLWHGRAGVAEHLYSETMDCSIVRWVLPSSTEVVVTDRRLAYVQGIRPPATLPPRSWPPYPAPGRAVGRHRARVDERMSGGVHWQWPDHLHVRPGNPPRFGPDGVRSAQPTQVRLVCRTGPTGGHPTLVLSGGDLVTVEHADRLANLLRRVIAQFRLEHVDASTLSATQSRALARRLIGPEFANHLGGASQAVSLPGALPLGTSGHTTAMTADRARAS